MKKSNFANMHSDTNRWPNIPPWWLLSSPQVATVLGVTTETLHSWRTLGTGPETISTARIRPSQGNPTFYRLAQVKKWATMQIGMPYCASDQVTDFLIGYWSNWHVTHYPLGPQIENFDNMFEQDRNSVRRDKEPKVFDLQEVLGWDNYYSKQPRFRSNKIEIKYYDFFNTLLKETPHGHMSKLTPRQLENATI